MNHKMKEKKNAPINKQQQKGTKKEERKTSVAKKMYHTGVKRVS